MHVDMGPCVLCDVENAETIADGDYDGIHQRCPQCGEFWLTGTGAVVMQRVTKLDRVKIFGHIRDQNALREVPELTSDRIKLICAAPLPRIVERADRLLSYAIRSHDGLGARVHRDDPALVAVTYSKDSQDVNYLLDFLNSEGLARRNPNQTATIEPKGYMRFEALQQQSRTSAQGFVAMWFDDSMQPAFDEGFDVGIRRAGYDPLRVDNVEHIGKIDDEIIAQIRRSRFVIADFTGHRAGVYFEAGFALGLNLPVIWTCRKNDIHNLHFDIRQFNCIDWEEPPELATRLSNRIEAVIGEGPRKQ